MHHRHCIYQIEVGASGISEDYWFSWFVATLLQVLHVREFSFHQVNANLLWPGAVLFAEWIVEHHKLLEGRKVLELGRSVICIIVSSSHAPRYDSSAQILFGSVYHKCVVIRTYKFESDGSCMVLFLAYQLSMHFFMLCSLIQYISR